MAMLWLTKPSHGFGRITYLRLGWRGILEVCHDKLIIEEQEYMERWYFRTFLFQIRLHKILASDDPKRPLHDHAVGMVSLILKGSYREETPEGDSFFKAPAINVIPAARPHRLTLGHTPVWTLVLTGRAVREWGFLTRQGWMHHERFFESLADSEPT